MRRSHTAVLVPLSCLLVACGTSDSNEPSGHSGEQAEGHGQHSSATKQPGESSTSAPQSPSGNARSGSVEDVTVSGAVGQKPTVKVPAPMSFATTQSSVVKGQGSGPAADGNATVTANYMLVNASTGKTIEESWSSGQTARLTLGARLLPGLNKGLTGAQEGQRVVIAMAPGDAFGDQGASGGIKPGDSLVWVVDVVKVEPLQVMKALPPSNEIPSVVTGQDGKPTGFKATGATPEQVDHLGAWMLKQGQGPAVQPGQEITVNYLGALYPDGKVFDESYTKQPATFGIGVGQVIPGWDKALVGQKVGSRLVLTIPSDLAYGAAGRPQGGIPGDADLIFVVDIVGAR